MPALDISVLGQAQVLVDGKTAVWQAAGAIELFYFLLAHPEGRTKEDILAKLWNKEVDGASGNRFRVTMHRLRAALGGGERGAGQKGAGEKGAGESVLEVGGRFKLSQEVLASSDLYAMHRAFDRAEHATDDSERRELLEGGIALYHGDFLPDLKVDWAVEAREEHRAAYVRAALELSLLYCDQTRCEAAVASLARALKADPFIGENYHQDLMTCMTVIEQKYGAVEHYRDFLRLLRDDLDDTPMLETVRLYDRIKGGQPLCSHHIGGTGRCSHIGQDGGCGAELLTLEQPDLQTLQDDLESSQTLLGLSHDLIGSRTRVEVQDSLKNALLPVLHADTVLLLDLEPTGALSSAPARPALPSWLEQGLNGPASALLLEVQATRGRLYLADTRLRPELGLDLPRVALGVEPVRAMDGVVRAVLLLTRPLEQGAWTAHERGLLEGAARTVALALERMSVEHSGLELQPLT